MESSHDWPVGGCLSLSALLLCPHWPCLNLLPGGLQKKSKWKPPELLIHLRDAELANLLCQQLLQQLRRLEQPQELAGTLSPAVLLRAENGTALGSKDPVVHSFNEYSLRVDYV